MYLSLEIMFDYQYTNEVTHLNSQFLLMGSQFTRNMLGVEKEKTEPS